MSNIYLENVENTILGFDCITKMLNDAHAVTGDKVVLYVKSTWLNASMSPALYVALKNIQRSNKKVFWTREINPAVERILSKNGFLFNLIGKPPIEDVYQTTVPFKIFSHTDAEIFTRYVKTQVTHHQRFPKIVESWKTRIENEFTELFINAVSHNPSPHFITVCGQLFPNKDSLEFCIADAGVGIPYNVRQLEPGISDEEAILWATKVGNTTRKQVDKVPGGLGLATLKRFINLNRGRLMLVSGCGFYEFSENSEIVGKLAFPFPGTVAFLAVRTEDSVLR
jgi:hypothetical protein